MPQSTTEYLQGYIRLIGDTLSQRFVNRAPPQGHELFHQSSHYLQGKVALITGANTGIGFQTTKSLASAGATVVLACRNRDKAEAAADAIRRQVPNAKLEIEDLDLSSLSSVRECARAFSSRRGPTEMPRTLHILVLNGGVMGAQPTSPETHFMVNHVGHALLALLLLPNLLAAKEDAGRIVLVSSLTSVISDLRWDDMDFTMRRYNWMTAYANSKLAMLLFMKALVRRLGGASITVNAVHPGEATSDVARYLGRIWMWLHQNIGKFFLLNTIESARTSVYVAGAKEIANESGHIFHRVWHKMAIPERLLNDKDVEHLWEVTLRMAKVTVEDMDSLIRIGREHKIDGGLFQLPR